ncbi:hypothetical protein GCM10011360_16550 [Primorskyibacter flagellatus]|uniref:Exonuclease domain-containing protein n=1 Tax=Primorskyibacter flagellatus TaxID=1387277 RepID=A0A917EDW5_9RHOB|nr:hypothetical protein [Primorskyibacter flagellatus]GGE29115.1 hypothetical protein GCM10011360_16550 [Primorskyibacter flagellatus]
MADLLSEVVFLDFEASSLAPDGWPIEIGLTWIDELDELVTWSSLIRPHPNWSSAAWCADAEAIHQLSQADLLSARPAEDVAAEANAMIADRLMISDGRTADARWLDQLLATVEQTRASPILDYDATAIRHFNADALDALYTSLTRRRAPRRAGPDSRRLARAWLRALEAGWGGEPP